MHAYTMQYRLQYLNYIFDIYYSDKDNIKIK